MAGLQSLRAFFAELPSVLPANHLQGFVGFPEISQLVVTRYRATPPCLVDLYMESLGYSPDSPTFLSVLGVQTVELPILPNRTLHGLNPAHVTF